jgi:hypothetical protein
MHKLSYNHNSLIYKYHNYKFKIYNWLLLKKSIVRKKYFFVVSLNKKLWQYKYNVIICEVHHVFRDFKFVIMIFIY